MGHLTTSPLLRCLQYCHVAASRWLSIARLPLYAIKKNRFIFVRATFLDPSIIWTPPPKGSSNEELMSDLFCTLGRSDKAIDLLSHLTYIDSTDYEL